MKDDLYSWADRHGINGRQLIELLDIIDPSRPVIRETKHASEAAVQADLRVIAGRHGCALWRNNNGASEMLEDSGQTRHVRFGLGNDSAKLSKVFKSSDLIGITPLISTAPGQRFGVFTAVEVKTPGWVAPKNDRERAQARFLSVTRSLGGIGMFAQSTADYEGIFKT